MGTTAESTRRLQLSPRVRRRHMSAGRLLVHTQVGLESVCWCHMSDRMDPTPSILYLDNNISKH